MTNRKIRKYLREQLEATRRRVQYINAPEDEYIRALCEQLGYGAVMDSAMRSWLKKGGGGAFIIGGSYDVIAHLIGERLWDSRPSPEKGETG